RIEEAADKAGIKIFIETDLKHRIERVLLPLAGDLGNRAVGQPSMFRLDWRGDDDPLPVALEHRARPRGPQIGAKTVPEASIAEGRFQLFAVVSLDRVEGGMAVERVGARQRKIEGQRLAG